MPTKIVCANQNLPEWKELVKEVGDEAAHLAFFRNGQNIPTPHEARILLEPKINPRTIEDPMASGPASPAVRATMSDPEELQKRFDLALAGRTPTSDAVAFSSVSPAVAYQEYQMAIAVQGSEEAALRHINRYVSSPTEFLASVDTYRKILRDGVAPGNAASAARSAEPVLQMTRTRSRRRRRTLRRSPTGRRIRIFLKWPPGHRRRSPYTIQTPSWKLSRPATSPA
jgi:hypothetical protein